MRSRRSACPSGWWGGTDCTFTLIGEEPLDRTPAAKNGAEVEQQAKQDEPDATFGAASCVGRVAEA